MFVCGPTVYGPMHLGHARTYISFDLVYRLLKSLGYHVHYIQNVTDVGHLTDDADQGEDKIIKEAIRQGRDPGEIATFFFEEHKKEMQALGNLEPEYHRATDYIPQIIEFTQSLIEKDFAYEVEGNVYFALDKFPQYGELSGHRKEEQLKNARLKRDPKKKSPYDFALWLKAPADYLVAWDSPWGRGFPGWHIEDSAIIRTVFGNKTIDIHGGAIELAFPHHENEIAQFEALTGEKQARFWLHTGLLLVGGEKMSKSKNNFVTVKELLERFPKQIIRLWVFRSHFRSPIDFNEEDLEQARLTWKKIERVFFLTREEGKVLSDYQTRLREALLDNFNTPQFLSVLHEMLDRESFKAEEVKATLLAFDEILGLDLGGIDTRVPREIAQLVERREAERKKGNFDFADTIRSELLEKGWQVDDTPSGPVTYPK